MKVDGCTQAHLWPGFALHLATAHDWHSEHWRDKGRYLNADRRPWELWCMFVYEPRVIPEERRMMPAGYVPEDQSTDPDMIPAGSPEIAPEALELTP